MGLAALSLLACRAGEAPRAVATVTLEVAVPGELAAASAVWRARLRALDHRGGLRQRSARFTPTGPAAAQVIVEVLLDAPCQPGSAGAVTAPIEAAITRSGHVAFRVASGELAKEAATRMRAALPDGADATTLGTPGAITVTGVEEAFVARWVDEERSDVQLFSEPTGEPASWRLWVGPRRPQLGGEAVTTARVDEGRSGGPVVRASLSTAGRDGFVALTGDHLGAHLLITVDDRLLSAPIMGERLATDHIEIVLGPGSDRAEAEEIATLIGSGALPVSPSITHSKTTCQDLP